MIYAQMLQEKASGQAPSDAAVKAKYDQLKAQNASEKQYSAAHILVKDEKTAKTLIAKLNKGAKFAELARKNSLDQGSKVKGGELGWSTK